MQLELRGPREDATSSGAQGDLLGSSPRSTFVMVFGIRMSQEFSISFNHVMGAELSQNSNGIGPHNKCLTFVFRQPCGSRRTATFNCLMVQDTPKTREIEWVEAKGRGR